jgi:hypothetical protein
MVPLAAGLTFGTGISTVFIALSNYLTNTYTIYSASVMTANSFLRFVAAALLPLAAKPLYSNLGVHWASSLLGFVAVVLAFIPVFFFRYGAAVRAKSEFCMTLARGDIMQHVETP